MGRAISQPVRSLSSILAAKAASKPPGRVSGMGSALMAVSRSLDEMQIGEYGLVIGEGGTETDGRGIPLLEGWGLAV